MKSHLKLHKVVTSNIIKNIENLKISPAKLSKQPTKYVSNLPFSFPVVFMFFGVRYLFTYKKILIK